MPSMLKESVAFLQKIRSRTSERKIRIVLVYTPNCVSDPKALFDSIYRSVFPLCLIASHTYCQRVEFRNEVYDHVQREMMYQAASFKFTEAGLFLVIVIVIVYYWDLMMFFSFIAKHRRHIVYECCSWWNSLHRISYSTSWSKCVNKSIVNVNFKKSASFHLCFLISCRVSNNRRANGVSQILENWKLLTQ